MVGNVDLTGVDLVLSGTYTPATGDQFMIVNNDGPNDVIGEFNVLHDGQTFQIASGTLAGNYTISYHGGDGNDVVIDRLNVPPSFTSGVSQTAFDEDAVTHGPAPEQVVANWASNISAGPSESAQNFAFHVDNDNHAIFAVQPTIDADGTLHYTPNPNTHGVATVTVYLQDNAGGTDTSDTQQFTIEVKKLRKLHNASETGARNGRDVTDSQLTGAPDGFISAGDVLAVINYINAKGSGAIPASAPSGPPYCDVDADDQVVAQDVVAIINYINAHPGQPEGEAASAADDSYFDALAADQALAAASVSPTQPAAVASLSSAATDLISLLATDIAGSQIRRRRV